MAVYTSQNEVQTAMYALLMPSGALDSVLASLGLLTVYDLWNVPQNAVYPYMTIGDGYEIPSDTFGPLGQANGFQYYSTFHVWSDQLGTELPSKIIGRLNEMFHRQTLSLATLHHVSTMYQRAIWMYDATGIIPIQHVSLQYLTYATQ